FLPRGKPGAEDHGDGGAAVHGGRLLEAKELLTERRLLQRLCTDSDAIVLEDELVSVGSGREGDLDRAGLVLVLGAAHYRTLDPVVSFLTTASRVATSRTTVRWASSSSSFSTIGKKSAPDRRGAFLHSVTSSSRCCNRAAMLLRFKAEASPLSDWNCWERPCSLSRNSPSLRAGLRSIVFTISRPVSAVMRKAPSRSGST